jgi:hypothetical protein
MTEALHHDQSDRGALPQETCPVCGAPVLAGPSAVERCDTCLDRYLRSIDATFLDSYTRFGARSRQVVAEACLRSLVLSDLADRKILGVTVYEQFVQAMADLINLYNALQNRQRRSIAYSFLSFSLDQAYCLNFFSDLLEFSPGTILDMLGLAHPERVAALYPELTKRESRELMRALHEALADFDRLTGYQELGEVTLVRASEQMRSVFAIADRVPWKADTQLRGDQVAAIALDACRGKISLDTLSVDEPRLAQVVDGIDVITRLTRNLIYAYLSIHAPEVLRR